MKFIKNKNKTKKLSDIDPMEFILGENIHVLQGGVGMETNQEQSMIRQTYSRLSTMYCMLTDYYKVELSSHSFKSLNLESLALKWMDPSYEIRDAAQTLLKNELKRMGPSGRAALIKSWEPHLTSLLKEFDELNTVSVQQQQPQQIAQQQQQPSQSGAQQQPVPSQPLQQGQQQPQQQIQVSSGSQTQASQMQLAVSQPQQYEHHHHEFSNHDVSPSSHSAPHSSRIKRKQYVSIIILSLIGAEFGQDVNANKTQAPYKTIPQGFSLEDHSILKRISNFKCIFIICFLLIRFYVKIY